jgi:hypothetical protein
MSCKKKWMIKTPATLTKGEKGDTGPVGPQGPAGEVNLPLSSDEIEYGEQTLTEILDQLLYTPLEITTFSGAPLTYERGQVITSLPVSWAYNKAVESQSITGTGVTSPSLAVEERSKTLVLASISTNTTITLEADDETEDTNNAQTATLNLRWYDGVYWGVGAIAPTLNSAFILGLSGKNLRSSRQGSFSLSVGVNQRAYIAIPVSMGAATFKTNGFNGGLSLEATIAFTNSFGATVNYNIYATENHSLGLTAFEIL